MEDAEAHEDGELLDTDSVEWVNPENKSDHEPADTESLDEANGSVSDTEGHQDGTTVEDESDDEQDQANFDLEEPEGIEDKDAKESNKAAAVKERQLNAWERDIKSGKKSIDDLPANLKWMEADLEERIAEEPAPHEAIDEDINDRIDRRLKEREDGKVFQTLKSRIPNIPDPKTQKGVKDDYLINRKEGLSQRRALELAMKANGVPLEARTSRKEGVRIPKAGFIPPSKAQNLSNHDIAKLEGKHGWNEVRKQLSPQQQNAYLDWQGQDKNQYI